MKIALKRQPQNDGAAVLEGTLPPLSEEAIVRYEAPEGALLRVDGNAAGAFDRKHREVVVKPSAHERVLTLEVEAARPRRTLEAIRYRQPSDDAVSAGEQLPLWGHSHLDVAWLWTYEQARGKAMRTFANALALLDEDPSFVFMQSQPQLYEFVRTLDGELFSRVVRAVDEGRFDADVAAMWVEPDCNIPSGESLLRQMLAAHRYCVEQFGIEPSIAWLPDTFGFARTLPTLLAHAGIAYFGTTKLEWNDTTRFPYPQFRWRGPDGSEVVAASLAGMDGGIARRRVRTAKARREPLVVGYGDGGGGPTREQLRQARGSGHWERPHVWFARTASRDDLPVHDGELYLEYHRGVYTTHHDVKAENAALERRLRAAEEGAAWCVAVRAPRETVARASAAIEQAWTIVLRNQFHDVLPGTSIPPVYADARAEYARAAELLGAAETIVASTLPRAAQATASPRTVAPVPRDGAYVFENDTLHARVLPSGAVVELHSATGGGSAVSQGNVLARYRDRPSRWEAWNLDAGYVRWRRAAKPHAPSVAHDGLEIPFDVGRSRAMMRVWLLEGEPFLRVDLAVDWRERRTLLRHENWLAVRSDCVLYGVPHGTVERSALARTTQERARFEVPGQRFAAVRDAEGNGVACLTLDTYGWSARALPRGGVQIGHSLLRGPKWPDPGADLGEQQLSWAYAPLHRSDVAAIERLWLQFSGDAGVKLFASETPAVIVVACKPAEDGDGVVVRARECNGVATTLKLKCGGRMRSVEAIDALERRSEGDARIQEESLLAPIGGFALKSFRVRF